MRFPRILTFYAAREVLQYALLGFLGVGAILFTQNALRQLSDFASMGLQTRDVLAILGALVAMLSAYAVPVAFLFGVLVAVGRLSSDSELKAMRALGVSLGQFTVPFIVLALGVSAATAWLLATVEPKARTRLTRVAADIASRGAIVEPVFGQTKDVRGVRRFRRRGYAACDSEWQLICASHNLLKLWRHGQWPPGQRPAPLIH